MPGAGHGQSGFFDAAEMRLLGELSGDIAFALDHIKKAERLNYLAYYDALTGLANRTFFYERLARRILEGTSGLSGNEVTSETETVRLRPTGGAEGAGHCLRGRPGRQAAG